MLADKVSAAHGRISFAFGQGQRPALLCSFGKDSLVMLDLLAQHGIHDALYLENIDEIVDWNYIAQIKERYSLNLGLLPKGRGVLFFVQGKAQFMCFPFINRTTMLPVPMGLSPWKDGPFMCVDEELRAELGTVLPYDYDVFFMGSKTTDLRDNGVGCLPWLSSLSEVQRADFISEKGVHGAFVKPSPDTTFAFPLYDWSQDDVWDYIAERKLPVSSLVYADRKRRLHENLACYRCHDPSLPAKVYCPKVSQEITNLGHFTQESDLGLLRMQRLGVLPARTKDALNG